MKQFRKILALLLIVVMAISFALPTAATETAVKKFSDDGTIDHKTAVYVLSALKVVGGYPNGTFRPTTSVTRAEMCKMLSVMLNGGVDPADQYAPACTFADCADHWAKGNIGYCVARGLVNGKNAATFDPEGKVTYAEEAKMLLCMLGYDASEEGFTGADWQFNVIAAAAKNNGLLVTNLSGAKPTDAMTRGSACQMMLNALQCTMVEYPNSSNIFGGVTGITINGARGDARNVMRKGTRYTNISDAKSIDESGQTVYTVELGEDLFEALVLDGTAAHDELGAPASLWKVDDVLVSAYQTKKAILSGDGGIKGSVVAKNLPSIPLKCTVYIDGVLDSEFGVTPDESDFNFKTAYAPYATMGKDEIIHNAAAQTKSNPAFFAAIAGNIAAGSLVQIWRKESAIASVRAFSSDGSDDSSKTVGAAGIHYAVYYDETERHVTFVSQRYYPAQIKTIQPDVTDEDGNVIRKGYLVAAPVSSAFPTHFQGCEGIELNETVKTPDSTKTLLYLQSSQLGSPEELEVGSYVALLFGHDPETSGKLSDLSAGGIMPTAAAGINSKKFFISSGILLDTASGVVTGKEAGKGTSTSFSNVKIGGTKYNRANKSSVPGMNDVVINSTYTVRYYTFGSSNVVFVMTDGYGNSTQQYLYVRSGGTMPKTSAVDPKYGAVVVDAKGVQTTVPTKINYGGGLSNSNNLVQQIAAYSLDKDGVYTLSPATGSFYKPSDASSIVSIQTNTVKVTLATAELLADDNTIFVTGVTDSSTGEQTFTAYTGVRNVPNITGASHWAYALADNGRLAIVFLEDATVNESSAASDYGMLVLTGRESHSIDEDNTAYCTVKAILKGRVTTLKLTESYYNSLVSGSASAGYGLKPFTNLTKDTKGRVTRITAVSKRTIRAMTQPQNGVVTITLPDGTTEDLAYHNNVLVYVYNEGSDKLEVLSSAELLQEFDTTVKATPYESYFSLNSDKPSMLAGLFICTNN